MLAKGMKFKEIAEKTAQNYKRLKARIIYIRRAYNCKNTAHLVYKFTKAGKI